MHGGGGPGGHFGGPPGGGPPGAGGGMQPPRRPRRGGDFDDYAQHSKVRGQRPVDCAASIINHVKNRKYRRHPQAYHVPPHEYYCKDLLPVRQTPFNPATALATQWVHTSMHPEVRFNPRRRVPFRALQWAPTGRRLIASTGNGELLVFNPNAFAMEKLTVAHKDKPCGALAWARVNDVITSGDDDGVVKLWQSNLVLGATFNTNQKAVRGMAFGPGEHKLVTAGQDGTARIWDLSRATMSGAGGQLDEDCRLEGHGGDVNCVHWHPTKSLILTGSHDREGRLWDPRQGNDESIATLGGHGQPLTSVQWHRNEYYFLTASRDWTVRLWDIRTVQPVASFMHSKDVMCARWHPTHEDLFTSCTSDGNVYHWFASSSGQSRSDGLKEVTKPAATLFTAHDTSREARDIPNPVNAVAWSPVGHLLATCSGEVKFWHRNKPGAFEETGSGEVDMDAEWNA